MARADQIEIRVRIVIERPVPGVLHGLQEDDAPLDPKKSKDGEPLAFDFPLRIERPANAPPKFFGKQVRREGKERRFVYIRIGQAAGQHLSPWTRRMKIDIHDIDPDSVVYRAGIEFIDVPNWVATALARFIDAVKTGRQA